MSKNTGSGIRSICIRMVALLLTTLGLTSHISVQILWFFNWKQMGNWRTCLVGFWWTVGRMLATYIHSGPVYVAVGLCDYSVNWYLELGAWKEYPHSQIAFYLEAVRMYSCWEISTNPHICKCGVFVPFNSRVGSIWMASSCTLMDTHCGPDVDSEWRWWLSYHNHWEALWLLFNEGLGALFVYFCFVFYFFCFLDDAK